MLHQALFGVRIVQPAQALDQHHEARQPRALHAQPCLSPAVSSWPLHFHSPDHLDGLNQLMIHLLLVIAHINQLGNQQRRARQPDALHVQLLPCACMKAF